MRILFFSHYYPPEVNAPASRTFEHAQEWSRAGHDVTVVTCAPNHPKGVLYPGYENRAFQIEADRGIKIVRVWTYLAANRGFLRRTLNYLSYLLSATLATVRLPRPDVYVSTSPQFFCGLAGLAAKIMRRRPWVFEVRDIWPESIVSVGAMRKGMATRLLEAMEAFAYRRADRIVAVSDSFVPHIAERCGDADKIHVVKNGVVLEALTPAERSAAAKQAFGFEGRFVAAYIGTIGMAHGLNTVLDAAALLRERHDMGFLLVGDGAELADLAARAKAMALLNVRFTGQLPKAELRSVWAATDASLVLLRKSETFTKVLPSKMFEAMAMERPIVLGVEGEARRLLEEAGAGIAIPPESAPELASAIAQLASDPLLCRRFGASGAAYVRRFHCRRALAHRYLAILEGVRASRHGAGLRPEAKSGQAAT